MRLTRILRLHREASARATARYADDVDPAHLTPQSNPTDRAQSSQFLLEQVYDQLRAVAREQMRHERPGHTLQATALVHEAYLRMTASRPDGWASPAQFYHAAAQAIRIILIDHARRRGAVKRGGLHKKRLAIDSVLDLAREDQLDEALALDQAMHRLHDEDPEAASVVRLRFYAGLTGDRTAQVLGLSPRQVDRAWAFARAFLLRELLDDGAASASHE